jgi:hypothetical protein
MIDLATETIRSFAQLARQLPPNRPNRPVSPSTLWRWATVGCRTKDGRVVRLETVKLGGRSLSSDEALQRFADALTGESPEVQVVRTPTRRQRDSEAAVKRLETAGV